MNTTPEPVTLPTLVAYLDGFLSCGNFKDYCPNGLQVEGKSQVKKIVTGVTACFELIEAAIHHGADALIVHHGYFWKSEDPRITGMKRRRLQSLLRAELSLLAYHLPLDAHPDVGNNAGLAQHLGWIPEGRFGRDELGWIGRIATGPCAAHAVADHVAHVLGRTPLLVGDQTALIRKVAWCSGGAQDWFDAAIEAGADLFLSGEISEPCVHSARECGVPYLAAGHHATERYGVQALGAHLERQFGLEVQFIDIPNPV